MFGGFQVGPFQRAFQQVSQGGVPNVLDMPWYDAVKILFNLGIRTGVPNYVHLAGNTIPAEFVVAQSIAPGQPVIINEFMVLTVQRPAHLMTVTETINTTPFTFG